ncbi:MAG TPA: universal stress protein [Gaiellaceae bacterium]|jgi:nucleotide-binding universal stress UspA family protein|nr:universal stress protein [Gaiellaceae bacterium]
MSRRIVVGIDGSESANDALRWAVDQAKLTGGTVEAVYAWDPGTLVSLGIPPLVDWQGLREAAEERPREIVREVLGRRNGVRVVPKTVTGNAAEVLVEHSANADLLVVGSRGLGGLKGMLLGSVGHHCAAHSHCPVVIVHRAPLPARRPPRRQSLSGSV